MAAFSRFVTRAVVVFSLFSALVSGHPGEHYDKTAILKEMRARGLEAIEQRAQYDKCANSEEAMAREERALVRRAATIQRLREERGLLDG